MKDAITLSDLDAIRALSDPRRLDLLKALVEAPCTAKQLAEAVGEDKSRLYYHISELERCGLIEVVEERQKRNLIEKVYRATAKFFTVDRAIFAKEHGMEVFFSTVTSILDTTASDVHRLIESGRVDAQRVNDVKRGHLGLRLTADRRREFDARLGALLAEFSQDSEGDPVLISFVVYPGPA